MRENAEKPEGFIDHLLARTTTPSVPRQFESRAMDIAPIKIKRDYHRMLKEIEGLMTAKRNTPEGDRLDVLVTLVEAWEAKHYPLDLPPTRPADLIDTPFSRC